MKLTAHLAVEGLHRTIDLWRDVRASPKPHWRRPHMRRLHDGQIVIPIPPCYVNWDEDSGLPAPTRKDYKVVR